MNSLTPQDFDPAVDFSGHVNWSAALLDQAFTEMQPQENQDAPLNGVGLVLTTIDTALNTPEVPNPEEDVPFTKWKRYLWNRIPHSSSTDQTTIVYSWLDSMAVPNATFLKWVPSREDLTQLKSDVAANSSDIVTATAVANSASANATNALATANTANTTATNANNSVAAAVSAASAASTAATTALNTANAATVTANAANATAANALAVAQGAKAITGITPGTAGQRIRVNHANPVALEYYNEINTVAILAEQQNAGVDAATAAVAASAFVIRVLNTTLKDDGGIVTNLTANKFTLGEGVYKIEAWVPVACASATKTFVCQLYNNTDAVANANVFGSSIYVPIGTVGICHMAGVISIGAGLSKDFSIKTACQGSVTINGGGAASIGGVKENYTRVVITKIG